MKTRLLLLFLCITTVSFAQNWSQVGAVQFSNFASDAAITTHPTTGEVYIAIIEPLSSSKISVQKFDGTNWVLQGALVGENAANIGIAINPVNNQPTIAYRDTTDATLHVYNFDGTNWTLDFNFNVTLTDYKIQIQFNSSGDARFSGFEAGDRFTVIEKKASGTVTKFPQPKYASGISNSKFDFNSYDRWYVAHKANQSTAWSLAKVSVSSYAFEDFRVNSSSFSGNAFVLTNVSGISDSDFVAAYDIINKYNTTTGMSEPANEVVIYNGTSQVRRVEAANDIVQFRKNFRNNKLYLLYAEKTTEDIAIQSYNSDSELWSTLPSTGINSNSADFFVKMTIDKVNGNIFVLYADAGKISVKQFTIIQQANQSIVYVDAQSPNPTGDGSSWANANPSLVNTLNNLSSSTTEIWVAKGTYKPSSTDRNESFNVFSNNELKIYGGFAGTETNLSERDIKQNPTILSGDLNDDDSGINSFSNTTKAENSYSILKITAEDVLLDGITVANGNANGAVANEQEGSAITVLPSVKKIVLKNCTIENNTNARAGTIKAIDGDADVSVSFINSIFKNNFSAFSTVFYSRPNTNRTLNFKSVNNLYASNEIENLNGSGVIWFRNDRSNCTTNATFVNDTFVNNISDRVPTATNDVPVIEVGETSGTVTTDVSNTIFWNNLNGNGDVTIALGRNGNNAYPANSRLLVSNSLDSNNFSKVTFKQNIETTDPLFTSTTDFTLQANSPAINKGDNAKIPTDINTDILGNARVFDTTVDMGAYEFGSSPLSISDEFLLENKLSIYPNPTNSTLNISTESIVKNVIVYSLLGRKVLQAKEKSIDVSNLKIGLYLMNIETEKGKIISKKFMKK